MKRDEFEDYLEQMQEEHRRQLEAIHKLLKNAGIEIDNQGIVRYSDGPSAASVAPTYQAERLAQVRSYEVRTRMADVRNIAIDGVQAVMDVFNKIEAGKPMPQALENQLREIQEEVKKATTFVISRHAGNPDNNGYYR